VSLHSPGSLVNFFREFVPKRTPHAPSHARSLIQTVITGIVLSTNPRRSLSAVGEAVVKGKVHKSTVSRLLRRRDFRSRDMHWEAIQRAIPRLAPAADSGTNPVWPLALDGTALQRGAHTKIKGAIRPSRKRKKRVPTRRRQRSRRRGTAKKSRIPGGGKPSSSPPTTKASKKGRKTKYHTFLVASLTTHLGVRIPLPRYTCDPKDFKHQGRPPKNRPTQMALAKLQIERALSIVPEGVRAIEKR